MNLRRLVTVAAVLSAAASFSGGAALAATPGPANAVRPATFIGHDEGSGPTLAAAEQDAINQLYADYYGCIRPAFITSDGQLADGTWWADSEANGCQGYN
jgi:hypothetical protein